MSFVEDELRNVISIILYRWSITTFGVSVNMGKTNIKTTTTRICLFYSGCRNGRQRVGIHRPYMSFDSKFEH